MGTFRQMAGVAADPVVDLGLVRNPSPMVHAILALVLLLVATVLGVYKPFGMTVYGRRKQDEPRQAFSDIGTPSDSACNRRWQHTSLVIRRRHHRSRYRPAVRAPAFDRSRLTRLAVRALEQAPFATGCAMHVNHHGPLRRAGVSTTVPISFAGLKTGTDLCHRPYCLNNLRVERVETAQDHWLARA